ncbi:MAG: hypothetical protein LAT62_12055 [Natronospirillum sp.]|uniref:DnaT-like ssDNA-binding domain-containing protein n=1 Tax=Natronospirillum sp. TaxID=2812955 RepID=UPI0025E07A07|nr:DnaT-like ssDNA-binding domain-containing protein [Natronospirillum sp.]MCH8552665.1 hypothetical protein [Natronospirillum sp.]
MTKSTFTFQSRHASQLGLEAAVLLAFVQEQVELQSDASTRRLVASESRWLEWLPFLNPASFWTAAETLIEAGWLVRLDTPHGELGLAPGKRTEPLAKSTGSGEDTTTRSVPLAAATSRSAWPASSDDALDDYDMPPPMPTLSPMLTGSVNRIDPSIQAPRRYSDEPLYARDQEATDADCQASAPNPSDETAVPSRREQSVMTLDWQPGEDCLTMIRNRGIEAEFALAQRESFVLYYRDSGQRHLSWDTKFFNWVSRRWQYHLNDNQNDFRAATSDRETGPRQRRQKVRERLRDIGDIDW